jgi:hypothetical protein
MVEEVTAYVADTVRSLLPLIVKTGIATEAEVGLETLAKRSCVEVLQHGGLIRNVFYVGAWARKA